MRNPLARIFESRTGHAWAEADEFERTHAKTVSRIIGGMAIVAYSGAVDALAPGITGDILSIPPALGGFYLFGSGIVRASNSITSWKSESDIPPSET